MSYRNDNSGVETCIKQNPYFETILYINGHHFQLVPNVFIPSSKTNPYLGDTSVPGMSA